MPAGRDKEFMRYMRSLKKRVPAEERFASKIFKAEGHWLWIGACKPTGYGMFYFRDDECFIAHRASYIMHKGEIPDDLVVDHICKVKSCVNPDHLRLVPQRDNCTVLAKPTPFTKNSSKTHCKWGHPFSGDNLVRFLVRSKNGRNWVETRGCLTCVPSLKNHPRRFYLPEDLQQTAA